MRFMLVFVALLMSGCETAKLWYENPEAEFVQVVPVRYGEDVEISLQESGREYYCQPLQASTYPDKSCYARLADEDKAKRIRIKLLETPKTLAIDAVRTIIVVGTVTLDYIVHNGGYQKG